MNFKRFDRKLSPAEWRAVHAIFSRPVGIEGFPEPLQLFGYLIQEKASELGNFICLEHRYHMFAFKDCYAILFQKSDSEDPPKLLGVYAADSVTPLPELADIYRVGGKLAARDRALRVGMYAFFVAMALTSQFFNSLLPGYKTHSSLYLSALLGIVILIAIVYDQLGRRRLLSELDSYVRVH